MLKKAKVKKSDILEQLNAYRFSWGHPPQDASDKQMIETCHQSTRYHLSHPFRRPLTVMATFCRWKVMKSANVLTVPFLVHPIHAELPSPQN